MLALLKSYHVTLPATVHCNRQNYMVHVLCTQTSASASVCPKVYLSNKSYSSVVCCQLLIIVE